MIGQSLPLLAWPRPKHQLLTILIYHRIVEAPDPLRPGEVAAGLFARQMAFLRRNFKVLPLVDAVEALKQGRLSHRACCITFDDGYADNLTVAAPILASYSLPATVFVSTGFLDGGRLFYDTVTELVRAAPGPMLDLSDAGLSALPLRTVPERRAAISALLDQLRFKPLDDRARRLEQLQRAAGIATLPDDLMLRSEQVVELSRRGIEIGGHTVAHPILTQETHERAEEEIRAGKQALEQITGKEVRAFAYPNGKPGADYGHEHVRMVERCGFQVAVTTARGVAARSDDPLQLPRFFPWGRSLTALAFRLADNARSGKPEATCGLPAHSGASL